MVLHKLGAGQYLGADVVENGMVVEIVEKPYTEKGKFRDEQPVIPVKLSGGEQKLWSCNVTTWDSLFDTFGEKAEDWIGRRVKIVVKEENVRGTVKKVLYGEAVGGQASVKSVMSNSEFQQHLEKLGVNVEVFNKLSKEEQSRLIKKLSMQV